MSLMKILSEDSHILVGSVDAHGKVELGLEDDEDEVDVDTVPVAANTLQGDEDEEGHHEETQRHAHQDVHDYFQLNHCSFWHL